jgi:hypothetical protein
MPDPNLDLQLTSKPDPDLKNIISDPQHHHLIWHGATGGKKIPVP